MKINNKKSISIIIALSIFVLIALSVWVYMNYQRKQNTINKKISRYIENNCEDIDKCRVDISDFTNFEWDTFCFEDVGSPSSELIPASLPKGYGFRNGKMLFISQGKVVMFEEVPLSGFEPPAKGTIIFEGGEHKLCHQKNGSVFKVEKDNTDSGSYYYLLYNGLLRAAEYQKKINNPEKHISDYSGRSPEEVETQIKEWQEIINKAKE